MFRKKKQLDKEKNLNALSSFFFYGYIYISVYKSVYCKENYDIYFNVL